MPSRSLFARTRTWIGAHKVWSFIIFLLVVGGGYWAWSATHPANTQTYYVLGSAATSTIVATVSESGQVSTTNSVNIQPQVSGEITWVGVKAGDTVRAGQTLMTIDDTTALQTLADAKKQLASDELTYQQNAAQAPISYQSDQTALSNDQATLQEDYNNTYNDLTSVYLDLPNVLTAANNTLYGYTFDAKRTQWNMDYLLNLFSSNSMIDTTSMAGFRTASISNYTTANSSYTSSLATYQGTTRAATTDQIDSLLASTITTATDAAQVLQSELNYLNSVSNLAQTYNISLPSAFSTVESTASSNLATANSDLSKLLADQKTLTTDKQAIVNAQNTITLAQVGNPNGDNPITLQVSSSSIQKEEQDIANQEQDLAYYTISAPFAGTISAVSGQVGNNASGDLATIVSNSQIADLSVNEVDAAKINLGDKATLTFDAIPDLTLTGTVAEINPVGTVSQGVVSYDLQISFDTQDPRVKPGMTVNAAIETGVAENTLAVPASALKTTTGGGSYVLAFVPAIPESAVAAAGTAGVTSATPPTQIPVTTGLSDNTNIQILSGLTPGQQIVVSTRTGGATTVSAAASATSRTSGAGAGGFGGGGGGAIRIGG